MVADDELPIEQFLFEVCAPYNKWIDVSLYDKVEEAIAGTNFVLVENPVTDNCVDVVQTIDPSKSFRPQVKDGLDMLIKIGNVIGEPLSHVSTIPFRASNLDEFKEEWNAFAERNEGIVRDDKKYTEIMF